jgi:hypothetical protein
VPRSFRRTKSSAELHPLTSLERNSLSVVWDPLLAEGKTPRIVVRRWPSRLLIIGSAEAEIDPEVRGHIGTGPLAIA